MHHEYAVEPAAIGSSWEIFRYVYEQFGFEQGRLISRFPKKWERLVIEAALDAGIGDLARTKLVEKLKQGKRTTLIRTGRVYDPTLGNWTENALASHATRPFRAIVTNADRPEEGIISLDQLDAAHSLMLAPRSCNIPRSAADLASACHLLLLAARQIDLVDPYFHLGIGGEDYSSPLEEMMGTLRAAGKENVCVRIHYTTHGRHPGQSAIRQDTQRWVRVNIPTGYELHLYAWEQRTDGEDLHDRFLLCDCGGMMVGAGFGASGPNESAIFTLLDDSHVQKLRERFAASATTYMQAGRGVRVKSNGDAEFI